MYKVVSIAMIIVIVGGLIFAYEVIRGTMRGNGLMFVGICTGVASLYLLLSPAARRELSSGFDELENITFDAKFSDMKLNGQVSGTIKAD